MRILKSERGRFVREYQVILEKGDPIYEWSQGFVIEHQGIFFESAWSLERALLDGKIIKTFITSDHSEFPFKRYSPKS